MRHPRLEEVFRIRESFARIRIRFRILGSVHMIDPDPDPVLFVSNFQGANQK
jgi:hypothetical protein